MCPCTMCCPSADRLRTLPSRSVAVPYPSAFFSWYVRASEPITPAFLLCLRPILRRRRAACGQLAAAAAAAVGHFWSPQAAQRWVFCLPDAV